MNFETNSGDKVPGYYCELKSNNFFFTFIKGEKKKKKIINKESVSEKVCQMQEIIMLDSAKLLETLTASPFS